MTRKKNSKQHKFSDSHTHTHKHCLYTFFYWIYWSRSGKKKTKNSRFFTLAANKIEEEKKNRKSRNNLLPVYINNVECFFSIFHHPAFGSVWVLV